MMIKNKLLKTLCVPQKGSIFFYILLGVALFGALAFTVSRGFRSQSTKAFTDKQALLAGSDLIDYAQTVEKAVDKVRRKGCSESDISFKHTGWGHTQYDHTPLVEDKCKVFHPNGGGLSFENMNDFHTKHTDSIDRFVFVGQSEISGVGTTCGAVQCVELYLFVRMFHADNVCSQINKLLGISPDLPVSAGILGTPKYTGSFSYGNTLSDAAFLGENSGCYQDSSETYTDGTPYYDFYHVLLAR